MATALQYVPDLYRNRKLDTMAKYGKMEINGGIWSFAKYSRKTTTNPLVLDAGIITDNYVMSKKKAAKVRERLFYINKKMQTGGYENELCGKMEISFYRNSG